MLPAGTSLHHQYSQSLLPGVIPVADREHERGTFEHSTVSSQFAAGRCVSRQLTSIPDAYPDGPSSNGPHQYSTMSTEALSAGNPPHSPKSGVPISLGSFFQQIELARGSASGNVAASGVHSPSSRPASLVNACGEYAALKGGLNASLLGTQATLTTLRAQLNTALGRHNPKPGSGKDRAGVPGLGVVQETEAEDTVLDGTLPAARTKAPLRPAEMPHRFRQTSPSMSFEGNVQQLGVQEGAQSVVGAARSTSARRAVRRIATTGALVANAAELRQARRVAALASRMEQPGGAGSGAAAGTAPHSPPGSEVLLQQSQSDICPPQPSMQQRMHTAEDAPHLKARPSSHCNGSLNGQVPMEHARESGSRLCSSMPSYFVAALPEAQPTNMGTQAVPGPSKPSSPRLAQLQQLLLPHAQVPADQQQQQQQQASSPATEEHVPGIRSPSQTTCTLGPSHAAASATDGHHAAAHQSPSSPVTTAGQQTGTARLISHLSGIAPEATQQPLDTDYTVLVAARASGAGSRLSGCGSLSMWRRSTAALQSPPSFGRMPGSISNLADAATVAAAKQQPLANASFARPIAGTSAQYDGRQSRIHLSLCSSNGGRATGEGAVPAPQAATSSRSTEARSELLAAAGGLQVSFANKAAHQLLGATCNERLSRLLAGHMCCHPSLVTTLDELMSSTIVDEPAVVEQLLPAFRAKQAQAEQGAEAPGLFHLTLMACNLVLPGSSVLEPAVLLVLGVPFSEPAAARSAQAGTLTASKATCNAGPNALVHSQAPAVPSSALALGSNNLAGSASTLDAGITAVPRSPNPACGAGLQLARSLQPMLQLMTTALMHTSCILTILTIDGEVLYQNGRCVAKPIVCQLPYFRMAAEVLASARGRGMPCAVVRLALGLACDSLCGFMSALPAHPVKF